MLCMCPCYPEIFIAKISQFTNFVEYEIPFAQQTSNSHQKNVWLQHTLNVEVMKGAHYCMIHLVSGAVDDNSEVSALAEEVHGNITWLGVLL